MREARHTLMMLNCVEPYTAEFAVVLRRVSTSTLRRLQVSKGVPSAVPRCKCRTALEHLGAIVKGGSVAELRAGVV